jgi:UDPglucose 6-dehydrogenase
MNKPLIGFIGQGFIGKNYADDFENRGYSVVRYSLEEPHINNKEKITECDIVFIAVNANTTPNGFDDSNIRSGLSLVGEGKVVVIKSTLLPGMTKTTQKDFPLITVLFSPEFLSEVTAAHDAANPFSNIVGLPVSDEKHQVAATCVQEILPKAPFSLICDSDEAEIIKYTHNVSGYTQIITFNLMYEIARTLGHDWGNIGKALLADPLISNRYSNPVHKSGRGAGGHCFIKDFAAIADVYEKIVGDKDGINVLRSLEVKNKKLLRGSGKDENLLEEVYGK